LQNKFFAIIEDHEMILQKNRVVYNILGYSKLFLVFAMLVLMYFNVSRGFPPMLVIASIATFVLLVVLWIRHINVQDELDHAEGIIRICKQSIDRITGEWTSFADTGAEFSCAEHAYAGDLDIVGSKSLFQFLNTTNTWHGRQRFADDLLHPRYEPIELQKRQEAISELSTDTDFSNKMQYCLSKIGADPAAVALVRKLEDKTPFMKSKLIKMLLIYIPAITLAFIIGMVAFQKENLYAIGGIIVAAQIMVWMIGIPKTRAYLKTMSNLPYKLSAYSAAISALTDKEFSSEKLNQIQTQLHTASKAMKELGRIADKIRATHNGLFYFILNAFLLWDYECACSLEEWKNKYADSAEEWFAAVGEFESLLCFSHLPNACNNTCLPVIAETGHAIEAQGIGHPLLSNDARINNDLRLDNNIFIISGSNMSGKTTFLRTVGINLVLARCGSFVCAKEMVCPMFEVMTSMRISDDLNEGVSTFYAELKRIKSMIAFAQQNTQAFFLIDEIFRGTNSVDRLIGAKTVISKLNALGVSGMVSTHDLELCELAEIHIRIKNYSFSEHYTNDAIHFDYKIQPGVSKTTNAQYLMQMIGIT